MPPADPKGVRILGLGLSADQGKRAVCALDSRLIVIRRFRSLAPSFHRVQSLVTEGAPLMVAAPALLPMARTDMGWIGLTLSLVLLVLCLSVHEAAHAYMAWKCGDSTGKDLGRMTLNPIPHIDPFMTVILPGVLFLMTNGAMIFGGAKPVPVNFHRLRSPWRDMSFVALAGPFSNLLLACLFLAAAHFFVQTGLYNGAAESVYQRRYDLLPVVLHSAVSFNLLLTVFNLVPIPPLDGSRVMAWVLPANLRPAYLSIESFGIVIVFLLFYVDGFRMFINTTMRHLESIVQQVVTLGGLW